MRSILVFRPILILIVLLSAARATERPNVVIFLADDLGYGDLGCHGNRHASTPQIDAFAREATEFTNFHVSPVCAPTRAALLTGRYPYRTGVADVFGPAAEMDPAEVTLAERLRESGYATGIFGKWHLGDRAEHGPNVQGFDEALVHQRPAMRQYFDPTLFHNGTAKQYDGYCMDIFTDVAIAFIRKNRAEPFFIYLPANLIQAQRDYFGAHSYERVDRPRGEFHHTDWTGSGGPAASSTYEV